MKLQEFKDTPKEIKSAAFVMAKKDWLSILLHDWYSGLLDDLIDEYLASDIDIFNVTDDTVADGFAAFARSKGR
jgi:hypothetical protein